MSFTGRNLVMRAKQRTVGNNKMRNVMKKYVKVKGALKVSLTKASWMSSLNDTNATAVAREMRQPMRILLCRLDQSQCCLFSGGSSWFIGAWPFEVSAEIKQK